MNSTFFEALSIADLEKIHSQMISWIFNQTILSDSKKTDLLNKLFNKEDTNLINFKSYTEYNSMDIIIVTDNNLYVLENKLKSSQHSNQLNTYKRKIESDTNFKGKKAYFGFLTLIDEEPNDLDWINISYKDLHKFLKDVFKFQKTSCNPSEIILNEYMETLMNLVNILDKFDNDHKKFSNVFTDAGVKKYIKLNKNYPTKEQEYISHGNLEAIFQKHFLYKVSKKLNISNYSYHIGNTNGKPLIHVDLIKVTINGFDFSLGFQYQNNTVKFNIGAILYPESSPDWILPEVYDYMKNLLHSSKFERFNPPRSNAYISISKKIYSVHEMAVEDFISVLNGYITECENLAGELQLECKKQGWDKARTKVTLKLKEDILNG